MTCRAPSGATTCAGTATGNALSYNNQGQLATWQNTPSSPTSRATYLYDGEGNRVQQTTLIRGVGTTTNYIGRLEEVTTSGATTTTTAYYGGVALSVNGALSYLLSDGVTAAVSASSGAITTTQLYGPYGSVRYSNGTLPTSYGFTGQRADATTGLDYYNARYYDPVAGQFISADTTLAGGLNRYAYVGGNPETFVDPTGNHAQSCDLALCGGEGINLDGSLSSAQGGAPGDASGSGGSGGSSGSRGVGSGASTGETQASASTSTNAAESDGMLAGETFTIDPEGVGTAQGLETGEQYHLDEVRQAETKAPDGKNTMSPNDASTSTTPQDAETYRTSGVKDANGEPPRRRCHCYARRRHASVQHFQSAGRREPRL